MEKKENPMREISIEKVVLNIGVGESGEKLENARKILERITGRKALLTKTKRRTTFGTPRNRPIGVKVTLRGKDAEELLKKLLEAKKFEIPQSSFDEQGNFCFGIEEYIEIPGVEYDPEIGLFGMDVCVSLKRKGYRVIRRRIKGRLGKKHRITKDEGIKFAEKKLGVKVV